MSEVVNIYLSGSIKKGSSDPRSEASFWSSDHESMIKNAVDAKEVVLLNPAKTNIQRQDFRANYGCDLYLVSVSRVVLVDLREERGIGVGAELMLANMKEIPVVGWAPPNSYYRRDFVPNVFGEDLRNWTHPFAYGLCDYIVDELVDACGIINGIIKKGTWNRGADKSLEASIEYYLSRYPKIPL